MYVPLIPLGRYREAREITVRQRRYGGGLLAGAQESPQGLLRRARDVVFLIHGFNVDLCSAGCGYDRFIAAAGLKWQSRSINVYWPGDAVSRWLKPGAEPGILSGAVSAISYPLQVSRAKQTAQRLADLITFSRKGARQPIRLTIVAHSLGCRVTLELLKLLRGVIALGPVSVPLTILMAAAVPRYMVMPDEDLRPALETPRRVLIYYSYKDRVLKYAFRSGQLLERPFPAGYSIPNRVAVGLTGIGLARPSNVEEKLVANDHGEYWSDKSIANVASTRAGLERVRRPTPTFGTTAASSFGSRPVYGRRLQLRSLRSQFRTGCDKCPR